MPPVKSQMVSFEAAGKPAAGYLAVPDHPGPGVLVLHAWWGLTPFFQRLCDRLAAQGYVAFAPDLYNGKTAATIEEAQALLEQRDLERTGEVALAAVDYLKSQPQVSGAGLGEIGFSMGAAWALTLASARPEFIAASVLFYGVEGADFSRMRAVFQGHYAENDTWDKIDWARQMEADMRTAGLKTTFYTYPQVGHWFFEDDRPDAFDPAAAGLAWQRTLAFLSETLKPG